MRDPSHTPPQIDKGSLSTLMRKTAYRQRLAMNRPAQRSSARFQEQTIACEGSRYFHLDAALLERSGQGRDFQVSRVPCTGVSPAELRGRPSSQQPSPIPHGSCFRCRSSQCRQPPSSSRNAPCWLRGRQIASAGFIVQGGYRRR